MPIETRDAGTDPPPPLEFVLSEHDGCNLFECFMLIQADIKKAHRELRYQNTSGAPKVIKDNVLSTLGSALQQAEYFCELLGNARTVMDCLQSLERDVREIKTETKNLSAALQESNQLGKVLKAETKHLSTALQQLIKLGQDHQQIKAVPNLLNNHGPKSWPPRNSVHPNKPFSNTTQIHRNVKNKRNYAKRAPNSLSSCLQ